MLLDTLKEPGIIAVVRRIESAKTLHAVEAIIKGGITNIEITIDSEDALILIEKAKKEFGKDVTIGAGTILEEASAQDAIQAGAEFIFAPTLNQKVIQVAKNHEKIVIPGVMTPTEIYQAYEYGADAVKIFPASVLGSQYLKDIKGPLGHIPIVPTGGISLDNITDFLNEGAIAVGVGGTLMDKQYIKDSNWEALTSLARQFTEKAKNR